MLRNSARQLTALSVLAIIGSASTVLGAEPVIPTDGMVITEDTIFVTGTYVLPNGVSIGADNVTLDMNGAELVGVDFDNYGLTCIGFDSVVIMDGVINNYYYAMRIEDGTGIEISNCDVSLNWVDPDSQTPDAPWLNINVGPGSLGDRVNLGGGLYLYDVTGAVIVNNTLRYQENGMDLFMVHDSTIADNDASDNTGWGIHLHSSSGNTIENNLADRCIRPNLGDSAGVLLVMESDSNHVLGNSFKYGGDGFFIGNEWGCPSDFNIIENNDGSFAGANAFEATFSQGNQFIGNIANGSNYGFWLGYSHSGNVIENNVIRANTYCGIEIEHGQSNTIIGNTIIGNGGRGIYLRTDGLEHFPADDFPCLELPNQEESTDYVIMDNVIRANFSLAIELVATTASTIVNNLIDGEFGGTASSNGENNIWAFEPTPGENIIGGPTLGGNYWSDYTGLDNDSDGIGDTELPHDAGGQIAPPGDPYPLVGDPGDVEWNNPTTICDRYWVDLGRNTRDDDSTFNTSNGTHFATDGVDLYLLESTNSTRFSYFDPYTSRYVPRAELPESSQDGSDLQFGGGFYFATVGLQFNANDGTGRGSHLYAYDPISDEWAERASMTVDGEPAANEAIAYDSINDRLFATIVATMNGADPSLRRRLAIYDPAADQWLGVTADSGVEFNAASELEYLDGRLYGWRGGWAGGAAIGSDSLLEVYDIATDTWSATPTLQDSSVMPGFRTGGMDIWGVSLSADHVRKLMYVTGGESNRVLYVYNTLDQTWKTGPWAIYDGGWGASMDYVQASETLYQIDGRNSLNDPQGTAAMLRRTGDVNCDGQVDIDDLFAVLAAWGPCADPINDCPGDVDLNGQVNIDDLFAVLANWG